MKISILLLIAAILAVSVNCDAVCDETTLITELR